MAAITAPKICRERENEKEKEGGRKKRVEREGKEKGEKDRKGEESEREGCIMGINPGGTQL